MMSNVSGCSIHWHGVSGVPGLGCSVSNQYTNTALLKLWEEGEEDGNTKKSFSQKIANFFSFRSSKIAEKISSVPQTPVRRSFSAVTVSQRKKVQSKSRDTEDMDDKNKIKRSVSLVKVKNCKVENEKALDKESDFYEVISNDIAQTRPPFKGVQEDIQSNNKSQATQTDMVTNNNNEDYDYVYRSFF